MSVSTNLRWSEGDLKLCTFVLCSFLYYLNFQKSTLIPYLSESLKRQFYIDVALILSYFRKKRHAKSILQSVLPHEMAILLEINVTWKP